MSSHFETWLRAAEKFCDAVDTGLDPGYRAVLCSQMIAAYHEYRCSDDYRTPEIIQGPFEDKLEVTP